MGTTPHPSRLVLAAALALASCTRGGEAPSDERTPATWPRATPRELSPSETGSVDEPAFLDLDPAGVEPLEALLFEQPAGEGYRRVKAKLGPVLYSGKWLGLASAKGRFLGPAHVIVNVFAERPDHPANTPTLTNLILDIEGGEIVGEFERWHRAQWHHGLLLVTTKGDPRPYLFDAATQRFVLAVPEGEHDWELGRNYWLRFSSVAKRVWITARASDGTVHLYAWEPLGKPPELPDSPFPFMPDSWDPEPEQGVARAGFEEVSTNNWDLDCVRAVLRPPKGFECLEDFDTQRSLPLAAGWRLHRDHVVFNTETGEGYDLQSLCPQKGHEVEAWVDRRSPPRVRISCGGSSRSWLRWTPPDHVVQLAPELAERINVDLWLNEFDDFVELEPFGDQRTLSSFDPASATRVLISRDSECSNFVFRGYAGNKRRSAVGCELPEQRVGWFELHAHDQRTRARIDAREVVVGPFPHVLALVRRGRADELVTVTLVPRAGG